jgi:hypothetical protein
VAHRANSTARPPNPDDARVSILGAFLSIGNASADE